MKVCNIDRNLMYTVLQHDFRALQLQPRDLGLPVRENAWRAASNRDDHPFAPLAAARLVRGHQRAPLRFV